MENPSIWYRPIGIIHSGHEQQQKTPIQPVYARGCTGTAVIHEQFVQGLQDLQDFSHIYLLYHFNKAQAFKLKVKPYLEDAERGIFATRAPQRPNPVGISIVELIRIEANVLYLDGLDILDGTPLLDIKPYIARFDRIDKTRNGWQDGIDERFARRAGRRGLGGQ